MLVVATWTLITLQTWHNTTSPWWSSTSPDAATALNALRSSICARDSIAIDASKPSIFVFKSFDEGFQVFQGGGIDFTQAEAVKKLLDDVNMPYVVWFNKDLVQKEYLTKFFSKYTEDAWYFRGDVADYVTLEPVPNQNKGTVKVVVTKIVEAMACVELALVSKLQHARRREARMAQAFGYYFLKYYSKILCYSFDNTINVQSTSTMKCCDHILLHHQSYLQQAIIKSTEHCCHAIATSHHQEY
ncbi:hypothetical protein L7F22_023194 [Adiantum nelumboides]|nr:hypothetical protein [Adiantum nelumboides]